MADKKKEEKEEAKLEFVDEKKLGALVEKLDVELRKEMVGRPYLLAVTTGYVVKSEGDKATLAAQWSWRSNVLVGSEDSDKMAEFLAGQLKDVSDHPEYGVKKKYRK